MSRPEPNKQAVPIWGFADEAMLHLNDLEALMGGSSGPSIKLREAIERLASKLSDRAVNLVEPGPATGPYQPAFTPE